MDVYLQALRSNPELEQVGAQQRASRAGVGISRSYLLPHLHGSVSFSEQHGIRSSSGLFDTPVGTFRSSVEGHYRQRYRTDSITLNQVLFDLGRYEQLQASESGAAADAASYASAEQRLILRVAKAYFTVLADEAQLTNARSNAASLKKQLQQVQMKRDAGFASTTAVSDAMAAYNSALATAIRAEDAVHQDRQALARVTGRPSGTLKDLARQLPLMPPRPNDVDTWVGMALAHNPALRSQHKLVASAQHRISAARDSRLPTLNATVGYSHNPSWGNPGVVNGGSLPAGLGRVMHVNNRTTNTTLGLVLDIPLFSGGIIHSQVRKAIAQRDQAKHALESKRRAVVSRTRNAFTAIGSGIHAVNADKRAMVAAKKALVLTRKDYGIGTRTIVDLLIAQRNYYSALSTYSRARYALVIDQLNLKFASGTLSVQDLKAVNALLVTR